MTKQELITLYKGLNSLGDLKGVHFSYAVTRNINRLKQEIETLDKVMEVKDDYKEFDTARLALLEEHSKKGEDGKPLLIEDAGGQRYDVQDTFAAAFEALKEEHKEAIEAREAQIAEYNELLTTDTPIDLFKVKLSLVPEEITAAQMFAIEPIIQED